MSKHTPGPPDHKPWCATLAEGMAYGPCDCGQRLYATAPDLLAALEFLLALERDWESPALDAARSKARAAIAKAEGAS